MPTYNAALTLIRVVLSVKEITQSCTEKAQRATEKCFKTLCATLCSSVVVCVRKKNRAVRGQKEINGFFLFKMCFTKFMQYVAAGK